MVGEQGSRIDAGRLGAAWLFLVLGVGFSVIVWSIYPLDLLWVVGIAAVGAVICLGRSFFLFQGNGTAQLPVSVEPRAMGPSTPHGGRARNPGQISFEDLSRAAVQSREPSSTEEHEDERLARLLVSEMWLYNEEVIKESRKSRRVYASLQDDIDRAYLMYQERAHQNHQDFFLQALIKRFGDGDVSVFGLTARLEEP